MNDLDLWKKASATRKRLSEDLQSPIDIFTLVYNIESLSIVFYPMGDNISGMCIKGDSNIIAINSAMTLGRQRFTLCHELYHLFYDNNLTTIVCSKKIGIGKNTEQEADQFASYLLMPPDALSELINDLKIKEQSPLSLKSIIRIEQHFGISRQALLFRLVQEGEIHPQNSEGMRKDVILNAKLLGYNDALYRPLPAEDQYKTIGHYIAQAEQLLEKEIISEGKYEELLLDAFRSDLVYGDQNEGGELID